MISQTVCRFAESVQTSNLPPPSKRLAPHKWNLGAGPSRGTHLGLCSFYPVLIWSACKKRRSIFSTGQTICFVDVSLHPAIAQAGEASGCVWAKRWQITQRQALLSGNSKSPFRGGTYPMNQNRSSICRKFLPSMLGGMLLCRRVVKQPSTTVKVRDKAPSGARTDRSGIALLERIQTESNPADLCLWTGTAGSAFAGSSRGL